MALTQVSSKGIKNATLLNEDVNASADIAGSKLADNSISLAKLEHGDSNNDGKFLRANNGADPTFETITVPASINNLVEDTSPQLGGNLASNGNDILMADNDFIKFGTDNDFTIKHNNAAAVLENTTGHLMALVPASSGFRVQKVGGQEDIINCYADGAVQLYHDGSKKFETASTGTKITGKLDFTGSGHLNGVNLGASQQLNLYHDANDAYFDNNVGDFYVRNDGNSTTEKVRIQAKGGEQSIVCTPNGAVALYHDNVKRIETTNDGVNAFGSYDEDGRTDWYIYTGSVNLNDGESHNIVTNAGGYAWAYFDLWCISYHGSIGRAHWTGSSSQYTNNDNYVGIHNNMGYCNLQRFTSGSDNGIKIVRTGSYGAVGYHWTVLCRHANSQAVWNPGSSSHTYRRAKL